MRRLRSFSFALPAALGMLLCAASGCVSILGIEDASCDPTTDGCPPAPGAKVVSPLCQQYCNTVMSACAGNLEQYVSMDACVSVCGFLPPGEPGVIDNTVQCRLEVAQIAASSPEAGAYCAGAGPSGDGPSDESDCTGPAGQTNDPCASLCEVLMPACARFPQYGDMNECETNCRQQTGPHSTSDEHYTSSAAALPDRGNTVTCRIWHVSVAATGPDDVRVAGTHCVHAAGGNPCVTQQ